MSFEVVQVTVPSAIQKVGVASNIIVSVGPQGPAGPQGPQGPAADLSNYLTQAETATLISTSLLNGGSF